MIGFADLRFTACERSEGLVAMRPKELQKTGQADIFRSRLHQIVDMKYPLVLLAGKIDGGFLEAQFGAVYTDRPGRPGSWPAWRF